MPNRLTRRTLLAGAGTMLAGLAGCLSGSRTPPHGAVAVENDADQRHEVAVTVTGPDGGTLLDRTFTVDPGGLEATDQVIETQGTYTVRAQVGDVSREASIAFEREGPGGEEVYGYVLVYVDGPPTDVAIMGPPIGTNSPSES